MNVQYSESFKTTTRSAVLKLGSGPLGGGIEPLQRASMAMVKIWGETKLTEYD